MPKDSGYPQVPAGNEQVDFVWGNTPLQPNTDRDAEGGAVVVIEPNAEENVGWSGYSVYPSGQLDPALDNHVIAVTGYNGFPGFGSGGATGPTGSTGPTGPTGLVITLDEVGANSLILDEYGNPASIATQAIHYQGVSGQGGTIKLDFTVANTAIAANSLLTGLKAAGIALAAAPSFSGSLIDEMNGTPVVQQQDTWVRTNAGASLPELNLQFILRVPTMSSGYAYQPAYQINASEPEFGGYMYIPSGNVTLSLNTSVAGTYFALDGAYGNNPLVVQDNGTNTRFIIAITAWTTAVVGLFKDVYGNPALDQYGTPVTQAFTGSLFDNVSFEGQSLNSVGVRAGAGTLTLS